ncbi:MAG: anhydro-N-acetylmuramic acid kinase [Flavipsychrobacter sp.]|nr:anhydro-N-acetylmuramic acid kinase [Flavipsychrobacter sp.]
MVYKVIGLMSGSSMDGLDIVYTQLEEVRGKWSYEILQADCLPYTDKWLTDLKSAANINVSDFLKLNTAYGRYTGEKINEFIAQHNLGHKVHFIASHGHTVFHEPENNTTCQIGDGAAIAAITGLPVISDLRAMDVALGGQGAPIVPIGDKLLFGSYDYLLNIGGIANITIAEHINTGGMLAFDVCPANQVLNILAEKEGHNMDKGGAMAAKGELIPEVLDALNNSDYYKQAPPKSLSNEAARDLVFPKLLESDHNTYDLLHTATQHIAEQIAEAVKQYPHGREQATLLATGGGAFNTFLIMQLQKQLVPYNITVEIPDANVVKYKEALVMALIGTLRWREEINVMNSVTGSSKDSVGGALWLG